MTDERRIGRRYGPYHCVGQLDATPDTALFHALHSKTGKLVTLRVLSLRRDLKNLEKLGASKKEILDEIEAVQAIEHPNLMPILDIGAEEYVVYYTMPLMRGGTLLSRLERTASYLQQGGQIPIPLPSLGEIAQMTSDIAAALQAVHNAGKVHGQVEPRAIAFDNGVAYLAEVGMMKLQKILFHLDTTNSFSVTRYSAPELWQAERPVYASDQYALACITYELLTGRAPFESDTILGLMRSHLDETVIPPNVLRPDLNLPAELSMVFWQALAKPVDERFPSVSEFAKAFNLLATGRKGEPTGFFTMSLPSVNE